jgi:hypothetical protein
MKALELRIGNYIQVPFGDEEPWVRSVDTIYYYSIMTENGRHCFEHQFDFVPLTKEWLVKFGFEKIEEDEFEIEILSNRISVNISHWTYQIGYSIYWTNEIEIQHVHQLQNLYFALTGQELEIK